MFILIMLQSLLFPLRQNKRIDTLLPLIDLVYENLNLRINTNVLNEVIMDAQLANPAKPHNGKKFKIYYASQVSICAMYDRLVLQRSGLAALLL